MGNIIELTFKAVLEHSFICRGRFFGDNKGSILLSNFLAEKSSLRK